MSGILRNEFGEEVADIMEAVSAEFVEEMPIETAKRIYPGIVRNTEESRLDRAQRRTDQARMLDGMQNSMWAMIAILCRDVERDKDYLEVGCKTMARWREEYLPHYSKSASCDAVAVLKELQGWTDEEVLEVPLSTARFVVSNIASSLQTPELKEAARTMKPDKFEEHVIANLPDLHIEKKAWLNVPFEKSQRTIVEGAYELCQSLDGKMTRAQFFEKLSVSYLENHRVEAARQMTEAR